MIEETESPWSNKNCNGSSPLLPLFTRLSITDLKIRYNLVPATVRFMIAGLGNHGNSTAVAVALASTVSKRESVVARRAGSSAISSQPTIRIVSL